MGVNIDSHGITIVVVGLFLCILALFVIYFLIMHIQKKTDQWGVLEEFDRMINSREDLGDMTRFIIHRMQEITPCHQVFVWQGATYETSQLMNGKDSNVINGMMTLPFEKNIVAQTYGNQKIHESDRNQQGLYLVTIPLRVNQEMMGVLLLTFIEAPRLDRASLYRIGTNMAALFKVHRLIKKTDKQRIRNEKMYKFALTLQTMGTKGKISIPLLSQLQEMTGFDFIAYRSEENKIFSWDTAIGNLHPREHYISEGDILEYSLSWGENVWMEDTTAPQKYEWQNKAMIEEEGLKTIKVIPLIYNHKVLGGLLFGQREVTSLSEDTLDALRMLVNMIALHLENQLLYTKIENDATIIERQRISREIHDGLAQNIGFVNIQLHRLSKMLEKNQVTKAISEIHVIKQAVDDSYVELRETIDQLRDIGVYKMSLCHWLENCLDDFEKTNRVQVELEMDQMDKVKLSDHQLVQITRVLQEIFNNIRKHAKASKVRLVVSGGKVISMFIEDNGVGFDVTSLKKSKYSGHGLPILEERVRSINGNISIHSKPNEGTKIEIKIPMAG